MSGRLLAQLDRLPPRPRRATVLLVALALLGLLLAVVALSPAPAIETPTACRAVGSGEGSAEGSPAPMRASPVPSAQLVRARHAAELFLAGYLRLVYGRAPARLLKDAAPALRRELSRQRADATPAERRRCPRPISLHVVGTASATASATAMVADGGIAVYALQLTLKDNDGRWQVSAVKTS